MTDARATPGSLAVARTALDAGDKARALALLQAMESSANRDVSDSYELGSLYRIAGDYRSAERVWRDVAPTSPDYASALTNVAALCIKSQRLPEARELAQRAVEAAPDFVPARINLGLALHLMGDAQRAVAEFEAVLDRAPSDLDAVRNAVMLYDELGDVSRAEYWLQRYLALDPEAPDALYLRGIDALRRGDYQAGWRGYEHRWSRLGAPKRLKRIPVWRGEELRRKHLLITDEQGIGDQLLFVGCVRDVLQNGANVTMLCAPKLKTLFCESFPIAAVLASGKDDGALIGKTFDYQCAMGSLPGFFRRTEQEIASASPYLDISVTRHARMAERLKALGPGLKVGLSWRGGSTRTGAALRSIPLQQWLPVLRVPGVQFLNLQYTDCADEIEQLQQRERVVLHTWRDVLDDYTETAALTANVDLVVSVCTSLVSLAGGLGQRVWVLTPVSAGWMFQKQGTTTPWFPRAQLYRQQQPGQWRSELSAVARDLELLAAAKS